MINHVSVTLFVRSYRNTKNKPVWDKLRCTDPEIISAFNIIDCIHTTGLNSLMREFKPVVDVMKQCWDIEPRDRPQFRKIVSDLEIVLGILEDPIHYNL